MADFLPRADTGFNSLTKILAGYVAGTTAALGISPELAASLASAAAAWDDDYQAWLDVQNVFQARLAAKDEARAALSVVIRQVNAVAQAFPGGSDTDRTAAGLPARKKHRTRTAGIESHPVLGRADPGPLFHRLWIWDEHTPGRRAKPRAAAGCEVHRLVLPGGSPAPVDPGAMPFLRNISRFPASVSFDADDRGQTAWYAQRWVNKLLQPGPWGPITGHPVL